MSNFTILMDENKHLRITNSIYIYQGENVIDKIVFLIPIYYGEIDLRPFVKTFSYVDDFQNAYLDILVAEEEIYKEKYIRCTLPITTEITKCAGDIKGKLTLNHVDQDTLTQYVLHTSEVEFEIHPQSDYYKFSDSSLQKIDELLGQLETKLETIESLAIDTPVDLKFDDEGTLHLENSEGELLGDGVDVVVPSTIDDFDGEANDGVINLDEVYKTVTL